LKRYFVLSCLAAEILLRQGFGGTGGGAPGLTAGHRADD
jgi:hypothetical protein